MFVLLLPACFLFDDTLYDARLAELTATDSADLTLDDDADGWSILDGDCDDTDPSAYPDAPEMCDRVDNDCDNLTDEDAAPHQQFPDEDGDGYGNDDRGSYTCFPGDGWIEVGGDCNDFDAAVNPSAAEVCNGIDDDCNVAPDDGMPFAFWFLDADGDGWGLSASQIFACEQPAEGWITVEDDCDDGDAEVNPGAVEVCSDGIDNNCDDTRECGWIGDVDVEEEAHGTIHGEHYDADVGAFLSSLGDVDGDGIDDFSAYGRGESSGADWLYVFRGGLTGTHTASAASVEFRGDGVYVSDAAYSEELESYLVADLRYENWRGAIYSYPSDTDGIVDVTEGAPMLTGTPGSMDTFGEGLRISRALSSSANELLVAASEGRDGTHLAQGAVHVLTTAGEEVATIEGEYTMELFGNSVSVLPDLDGDGLDDLAVSGGDSSTSYGEAVSVFLSPLTGTITRSDNDGRYVGAEDDLLGVDAMVSLDLTGDGHNDLVVSAARTDYGRVYVLPGPFPTGDASGIHPSVATNRVDIGEFSTPYFGQSLTTGDFDADGVEDLVIGAPQAYNGGYGGNAVLLYGPVTAGSTISDYDIEVNRVPRAIFNALPGEGAFVGRAVLGLSANGEEYTDLLINAMFADVDGVESAGMTWLILGDGI